MFFWVDFLNPSQEIFTILWRISISIGREKEDDCASITQKILVVVISNVGNRSNVGMTLEELLQFLGRFFAGASGRAVDDVHHSSRLVSSRITTDSSHQTYFYIFFYLKSWRFKPASYQIWPNHS